MLAAYQPGSASFMAPAKEKSFPTHSCYLFDGSGTCRDVSMLDTPATLEMRLPSCRANPPYGVIPPAALAVRCSSDPCSAPTSLS